MPRDALGLASRDKGHSHHGLNEQMIPTPALLRQRNGRALDLLRNRNDVQHVIHVCWFEIVDRHGSHHKGEAGGLALRLLKQGPVIGSMG